MSDQRGEQRGHFGSSPAVEQASADLFSHLPTLGEVELGVSLWVSSLTLRFLWDCMGPTRGTTDVRLGCASSLSHRGLDFGEQNLFEERLRYLYIYIYYIYRAPL